MTHKRKLADLKPGEKAVIRFAHGCLIRIACELIFEGDLPGFATFSDTSDEGTSDKDRTKRLNLSDSELREMDALLDYLRSASEDRGMSTAAPKVEVEWFGRDKPIVEKFTNAELNHEGNVILARLLNRAGKSKDII